jgi:hypothetical protein
MRKTFDLLTRSITSNRFDDRLSQFVCYGSALLVLVLGLIKLCRLGLDPTQLFFGVLLVLCLMLLLIICGTIAGPSEKIA